MADIIFNAYPGITVIRHSGSKAHWQVNIQKSWFIASDSANCNVYGYFWHGGWPDFSVILLEHWPDSPAEGVPHQAFVNGEGQAEANFGQYASMPAVDLPGPYWCEVKGESDQVRGLGLLPGNRHVEWHICWDWVEAGTLPDPEPQPGDSKAIRLRVARALQLAVDDLKKDA